MIRPLNRLRRSCIRAFSTILSDRYPSNPRLDLKKLLSDPGALERNARERNVPVDVEKLIELNGRKNELTRQIEELNRFRNKAGKSGSVTLELQEEMRKSRDRVQELQGILDEVEIELIQEAMLIPNWSSEESPLASEGNRIVKTFGGPAEVIEDTEKRTEYDHVNVAKKLGLVDFEGAARSTGANFYFLKGAGALLELALINYAMSRCIDRGFVPVIAPDMAKEKWIVGSGFQPRSREFEKTGLPVYTVRIGREDKEGLALAGTSEVTLAGSFTDQILQVKNLPIKIVAVSHCFRPEVGHHSSVNRGLYRVHQFTKVEMFAICPETQSNAQFQEITKIQEEIVSDLGLSGRVLEMSRDELGAAASRKWDQEVWMRGRQLWGEVTSASNCTDYQSRRLNIRYRDVQTKELKFPHTLNGTACAVSRIIQAILEIGWQPDKQRLFVPEVLRPFMINGPKEFIEIK